jgi:KamA family protein
MHCRYCFRQNFDYETKNKGFEQELTAIAQDPSLEEIILSGGDPLSLPNKIIEELLEKLATIPHVKRVRFHSRFPIGIPERIDHDFVQLLLKQRFAYWFIVHANHPRELDIDVMAALQKLLKAGIPVLNQAVLLKGVNDSPDIQAELCKILINHGIYPYYLHQLDKVQGAQHFEVEEAVGKEIIKQLARQLPGYGVPNYVRETCGEPNKTNIL